MKYEYYWHDLRNVPDELPKYGQQVLVAYAYDGEYGEFWDFDIGEYWGELGGWGNTLSPVVAWRDIERK